MQDTPKNLDQKRADEKMLVSEMIALYCRRQHKTPKGQLCPACQELQDYALARIDKCLCIVWRWKKRMYLKQ